MLGARRAPAPEPHPRAIVARSGARRGASAPVRPSRGVQTASPRATRRAAPRKPLGRRGFRSRITRKFRRRARVRRSTRARRLHEEGLMRIVLRRRSRHVLASTDTSKDRRPTGDRGNRADPRRRRRSGDAWRHPDSAVQYADEEHGARDEGAPADASRRPPRGCAMRGALPGRAVGEGRRLYARPGRGVRRPCGLGPVESKRGEGSLLRVRRRSRLPRGVQESTPQIASGHRHPSFFKPATIRSNCSDALRRRERAVPSEGSPASWQLRARSSARSRTSSSTRRRLGVIRARTWSSSSRRRFCSSSSSGRGIGSASVTERGSESSGGRRFLTALRSAVLIRKARSRPSSISDSFPATTLNAYCVQSSASAEENPRRPSHLQTQS